MRRWVCAVLVGTCVVLAAQVSSAAARPPVSVKGLWWQGEVQGVAVDRDGAVVVAGTRYVDRDAWMVLRRYERGGRLLWQRTWDLPGGFRWTADARAGVAVGPEGTVYVGGIVALHTGDVSEFPDHGAFVRAYGPKGGLRWQRIVRPEPWQSEIATSVAVGPGIVVLTGHTSCFECEGHEGWVRAWSPNGRPLWVDDFEFAGIAVAKRDLPTDVAVGADASVYLVGVVDRLEDAYGEDAPDDSEVVVRRMSRSGHVVWTHVLTDRSEDSDVGTSIAVRCGRVVVAGAFGGGWYEQPSRPHPWLRSYGTDGRARWTRTFEPGVLGEWPAVALGRRGRVYLARFDREPGMRMIAMTSRGWIRWTGTWTGRVPGDLAVGRRLVRVAAQGPQGSHAVLVSFRA